ncbi:MAG: hypothetical protein V4534_05180 [Myxococcota bacterium]
MSTYLTETRRVEKNKRIAFLGTSGAGILFSIFSSAFLGLPLLALGIFLGVRWFRYRAQNGMRF